MLKTILIILLGLFFILNGFNHFYNDKVIEEYAHKKGLFTPTFSVPAAGILLIVGGGLLIWPYSRQIAVILLSIFLVLATFTIHTFWLEKEKQGKMLEAMNFTKNLAILTELLYIGFV
jgi:uncharacterized membrane protein YphA (DoxX/SURF4 family)